MELSPVTVNALRRVRALNGTTPSRTRDPVAWAAWQGVRTHMGNHTIGDTTALMALGPTIQAVWQEVVEYCGAVQ
jgi:hypothetical protein